MKPQIRAKHRRKLLRSGDRGRTISSQWFCPVECEVTAAPAGVSDQRGLRYCERPSVPSDEPARSTRSGSPSLSGEQCDGRSARDDSAHPSPFALPTRRELQRADSHDIAVFVSALRTRSSVSSAAPHQAQRGRPKLEHPYSRKCLRFHERSATIYHYPGWAFATGGSQ
jgi:hypothetical protein